MLRILKVKDTKEHKRAILERSEMYRETLKADVEELQAAFELKRKLGLFGVPSALLKLAVPLAGMFLSRRRPTAEKSQMSIVQKLMLGFRVARQALSMLGGLRSKRHNNSRKGSLSHFS